MKHNTNVATQVERAAFTLDLTKTPFDIKPAYEVELAPNGRTALIYKTTERPISPDRTKWETPVEAWRVVLVTRAGRPCACRANRYDEDHGKVFTDPLSLLLFLQAASAEFSKVKRTTTEVVDTEE